MMKLGDGITIAGKNETIETAHKLPGPGQYNVMNMDTTHEQFPQWTLKGRQPAEKIQPGPGPGQYRN